ncbi:TetR/AcrR family transcriptional regulator [Nocardia higoensis]|uniref:TetR/AcrR family transcriptional regulator n=1 Tax=Nocardia higoensis TaxID=228599 RepID=UPI0002D9DD20|nr:TetR/AcrR family transcriptional regulator [Nocardia higoensis]
MPSETSSPDTAEVAPGVHRPGLVAAGAAQPEANVSAAGVGADERDAARPEPRAARRGRPPQSERQAEQVRARIVRATAEVFSRNGSRGMTVARILEQAELARPTFYRYFGKAEEPLHVLLTESNDRLTGGIHAALRASADPVPLTVGLIDAYLDWARGHGRMLGPLFAEFHDPASPVSAYRERALDDIRAAVRARFAALGRPAPAPLDLDAALHLCEYVIFRISTAAEGEPAPEVVDAARLTMIRFLLPVLGTRADLQYALDLPGMFPPDA